MINSTFDPLQKLRFAFYGRMSSKKQNERSPQQQYDEVTRTLKRLRYPWIEVAKYMDKALTGKLVRKRASFWQMVCDIRSGKLDVDLILLDTFERFGRAEELDELRREMRNKFGILVLTSDSQFADRTTPQGKLLTSFESMRSTEENRVKSHQVLRGKRDALLLKHWPGGKAPFGYQVDRIFVTKDGKLEHDHSILKKDPLTNWIVEKAFRLAIAHSWGASRLTRALNADPTIPKKKPFHEQTINRWLSEPIYYGDYVWGEYRCDIIDDCKVREKNDPEDVIRITGFCEPTIPKEDWDRLNAVRDVRRVRARMARAAARLQPDKLIRPIAQGTTLKYPLSGLVRCDHCKRMMTIASSGGLVPANKRYAYYHCPVAATNLCVNHAHIREDWLRRVVLQLMLNRLFDDCEESTRACRDPLAPTTKSPRLWTADGLKASAAFQELLSLIQQQLAARHERLPDRRPALRTEIEELEKQIKGWSQSLSNPDLPRAVRERLVSEFSDAQESIDTKNDEIAVLDTQADTTSLEVSAEDVASKLNQLPEIVATGDPTRLNLELSLHIDKIVGDQDGRVVVRTCRLGALAGVADRLAQSEPKPLVSAPTGANIQSVTPRRRARLRVFGDDVDGQSLDDVAHFVADVNRFARLGDEWFWEDEFQVPGPKCWARDHAQLVGSKRLEGLTHAELAAHFRVTLPTIRRALEFAGKADPRIAGLPRKQPRGTWPQQHYQEVAELKALGVGMKKLCEHFARCDKTIQKALDIAEQHADAGHASDAMPPSPDAGE